MVLYELVMDCQGWNIHNDNSVTNTELDNAQTASAKKGCTKRFDPEFC